MGSYRVGHDWRDLACMPALKKEIATPSSVLAWRIPGTEEPGGLLSMGSHRVGHDWSDLAAAASYLWIVTVYAFHFFFLIVLVRHLAPFWTEFVKASKHHCLVIRIGDVFSVIPSVGVISFLFFFFLACQEVCQFYQSLKRNSVWFHWFFPLLFLLYFALFCVLVHWFLICNLFPSFTSFGFNCLFQIS